MTKFSSKRWAAFRLTQFGPSLIVMAAAMVAPSAALAQAGTSTLRGTAAPGVEVVATEVSTGSVRKTKVGADGRYVISGLQPGNYRVVASGAAQDVVVPVASVSEVDFVTTPAVSEKGAIVVTARRPSVETRTSQVNQFVSLHDIAALPQTTRNFLEFADTVPGMQFTVDQSGRTSVRGGAQVDSAVNIFIDGVSQKDFVGSGGGTSGSGSGFTGSGGPNGQGDPGNPFPQLAIAEYKVVSSNYTAEYGDASSAVIIAQTKSGTNQFHGEVFGVYTDEHLRKKRPDEIAAGTPKAKLPDKQYGAAISGPIVKDIAHFFFTWEHKSLAVSNTVFADGNVPSSAIALLPSAIASQLGPVTNPFKENLYFGKVDLEPSSSDRFELSANIRLENNFAGAGGQNAASTQVPYKNNVKRYDGRWQHNGNNWVNTFRVSYQDALSAAQSVAAAPQFDYVYFPNDPTGPFSNQNSAGIINVGGPGAGVGTLNRQKGFTFNDDLTFSNIHFAGDHTLKVGVSFGSIKLSTQNASSDLANATYFYAVTPTGVASTPYYLQFPNLVDGVNTARVTTRDKQYSAYIQDNWEVTPKLEVNLGLRWDREEVPAYLNYQPPQNVVDALSGIFPGTTRTVAEVLATDAPGAPGINIFDYLSNGHNRKPRNNFSPRIGFSYDVHGDGHFVLFGGYGRAYNRNLFSTLALETTKIAVNSNPQIYFPSAQTRDDFGQCLTAADINPANHCYAFDSAYLTPAGLASLVTAPSSHEVDLIKNNIKTPYSDQFSLGVRTTLGEWNAQATLSYIASYDGIYGRWGHRYGNGQFYQNGCQWCDSVSGVPGVGSLILFDNGFKDKNVQFTLGAQKPYSKASGWSATASYTFSSAKQNNSYAYGSAGNTYLFDYPVVEDYPMLRSSAVPRHRLVLTGTYDLPWDMQLAGKVALATSQSATAIYGCGPAVPTCTPYNLIGGGIGGVVSLKPSNFLGYKDIDVQLTKNFTFLQRITAYGRIDVLNVFNWKNYDPTAIIIDSTNGVPTGARFNKTGPIVGVPFTVKFSLGARF